MSAVETIGTLLLTPAAHLRLGRCGPPNASWLALSELAISFQRPEGLR